MITIISFRPIDFSEPNTFQRVHHEVKLLLSSGVTLHKSHNYPAAIQLFKKGVHMLHKCRLADEEEEKIQEKLLIKMYTNLAVCYNKTKQPLKACTACNELRRLNSLWNNAKVLFVSAKALRMIGQFDIAEKRLKAALKLKPGKDEILAELELLKKSQEMCNRTKLVQKVAIARVDISEDFKKEVDILIKNFKEDNDLHTLSMPSGLNSSEVAYIKETCIRENLFFNKVKKDFPVENDDEQASTSTSLGDINVDGNEKYALDKFEDKSNDTLIEKNHDVDSE